MSALRRGYLYGLSAYALWGFFPLYFKLLLPSGAAEILAHRIVWSAAFITLVLAAMRRWTFLRDLLHRPRELAGTTVAATLIGINWFTYIYAVNSDRVIETALGYFINPLIVVLLGVVVLSERLRALQWVALGVGGVAVVVLIIAYRRPPYVALTLALSFGGYGLVKKRLGMPAAEGLFVESVVLALPALAYLGWLSWRSGSSFGQVSTGHTVLMLLSGALTAIPLLLFAGAANRIPLSGLGILQYLAPTLQFGLGVVIFHEPMPPSRLAGFALVWLALAVFTVDAVRNARQRSRATRRATAPEPVVTSAR